MKPGIYQSLVRNKKVKHFDQLVWQTNLGVEAAFKMVIVAGR